MLLWNLWITRNRRIFESDGVYRDARLDRSRCMVREVLRAEEGSRGRQRSPMVVRQQHAQWIPPTPGAWKINVDGAHNQLDGSAWCGGIIRDSTGLWISGFSKFIGKCNALDAEF
ncbi:hypothetical protein V6N11_069276 [Hibiscus sabdariffa]|uniref:RNase H type-1 domain-containing protein n=2 Tax=Hibiscus sabdariffa TaxID=183260 RepID=A0ABR1Z773_9ROSI